MINIFRKSEDFIFNEYDKQFSTHHPSHFSDFQLLSKEGETVLLSIEGHDENLERNIKVSSKQRESDKMIWHVGKSYKDIRDEKEAPPKNVVRERLKNFEIGSDKNQEMDASNRIHQSSNHTPPSAEQNIKPSGKPGPGDVSCSSLDDNMDDSETGVTCVTKTLEHKRSVKDLLSDFEKKSAALQKEEKEHKGGIGSYLLKDTREAGHRRVCSDTETMNYATSSDEDDDQDFDAPYQRKIFNTLPNRDQNHQNSIHQTSSTKEQRNDDIVRHDGTMPREETYLEMTPAKSLSSLPNTPMRTPNHKSSLLSHNSITSLTSSHGSSQSINSQNLPRFNSDKNLCGMTPSEALTQARTGVNVSTTGDHVRTPSQTLVMEHFHPEMSGSHHHHEEETYVDMNEDGSKLQHVKTRDKEPILAKNYSENEHLDNTLTFDPPESPRYHEIDETEQHGPHYELLSNARSNSRQPQYEAVYHEISETQTSPKAASTPMKKRDPPPPLRPIEGLPDILGNAPTNKGNSSSDADDESSKDFDAVETKTRQTITLDDSFRPASFYLSQYKSGGSQDEDSSDSDLVSPPPVPASPPPMEEVLGFTSSNNFDNVNFSEGMNNVFAAARSSSVLKERSRRDSYEEPTRHPSVGSRTSFMSQHSAQHDSLQSLNREAAKSPAQRLHGSHQSLSSRELPAIPNQNLQGSQQSLASKEIQQIGSRAVHQVQSSENIFRNSPYHSREGSLDNEAFLFHKFTQGTSISDYYKRHGSDSAELSSSDTANYEQEYRRYHLENIQEVSNTLERSESGHNTSIISQELNISYNSVYDSRLQQPGAVMQKPVDDGQEYYKHDQSQASHEQQRVGSPRGKVPYYMSDIVADGTIVHRPIHDQDRPSSSAPKEESSSLGVVDAITKSMNALDVESKSYFEEKNAKENERIKMLRRSYTPDPYFNKTTGKDGIEQAERHSPAVASDTHFESNNVVRSKSLEGLLGDTQGGPKDNIGYVKQSSNDTKHIARPPSSTSRRGPPPPPPPGVPPLDITPLTSPTQMLTQSHNYSDNNADDQDDKWADNLRRASIRQRAKSIDSLEESRVAASVKSPPPTAPKPKTPVHMLHQNNNGAASGVSYNSDQPHMNRQFVPKNNTLVNHNEHNGVNEFQYGPRQPMVPAPGPSPGQVPARYNTHHQQQQDMFMQEFHHEQHYMNNWQNQPQQYPAHHGHVSHQGQVIQRNSVVQRNENFLDASLPSPGPGPTYDQRRSVSRPTSRGPSSSDRMGRQTSRDSLQNKSMTLPARVKYSQDSLPRDMDSFDSDNSPRTRTSKSGIHEDSQPVPPSPGPLAQPNIIQNKFSDPSFSSHKDFTSHQNYRGINLFTD